MEEELLNLACHEEKRGREMTIGKHRDVLFAEAGYGEVFNTPF